MPAWGERAGRNPRLALAGMAVAPVDRLAGLGDEVCAEIRRRFADAGFDRRFLSVAAEGPAGLFEALRFPLARAILDARDDAAARLALLFAFEAPVSEDHVRDALGKTACDALLDAGVLVAAPGGSLRSAYRVTPFEGLWIFTDHLLSGGDTVMIPGATTGRLVALLPSVMEGGALDLGCGHGILTLVAARRGAVPAVGTDINARAIALARFNARFNRVEAEFHLGDRAAPVAGQRFALVMAQPPYVVRPADSAEAVYMHGGALGDEIALQFLEAIPPVLAPGGRALVCFDSPVRADRSHAQLVRESMNDSTVDLVVLLEPAAPPDLQAIAYASVDAPDLGADFAASVRNYHRHFVSIGAPEFRHVVAVLRRPPDANVVRTPFTFGLDTSYLSGGTSLTLDALLDSLELATSDDEVLLREAVRTSPCTLWVDERPRPDVGLAATHRVRFGAGTVGTNRTLDDREYAVVAALDRSDTVAHAIEALAASAGTAPDALRAHVLAVVRQGLASGLLEPRRVAER